MVDARVPLESAEVRHPIISRGRNGYQVIARTRSG
jgi:hypothetical protein